MGVHTRDGRRPIPSRGAPWAASATGWLLRAGVRPNAVSLMGVVVAALGAACLVLAGTSDGGARAALLIAAAVAAALRLLCNLLDGMLAVEGGLGTPAGEIFNEVPDRFADLLLFVGAGYAIPAAWGPQLGWAAAAAALLAAYVRTLGVAAGAAPHFDGPMAKPRRMHVLIAACLVAAAGAMLGQEGGAALAVALAVVVAGCAATVARRLRLVAADLEAA